MYLLLHVIPKSKKNELVGWVATAEGKKALKVKVTAPPEDGKANAAIIKFLAKQWDTPASGLEIVSGFTSRHKRLKIHDSTLAAPLSQSLSQKLHLNGGGFLVGWGSI